MKRTILLLIAAVVVLALTAAVIIVVHHKTNAPTIPYLWYGSLTAIEEDNVYIITISTVGEKDKTIHFSETRRILKTKGIKPLKPEEIQIFEGMDMAAVIEQYGEPHADAGSGLYIPSYITQDAYLIQVLLDKENKVREIIKEDLINSKNSSPVIETVLSIP